MDKRNPGMLDQESDDLSFARCQFDPNYERLDPRAFWVGYLGNGFHIEGQEETGLNISYVKCRLIQNGEVLPSKRYAAALAKGQRWALAMNAQNLAVLPDRQLEAMLWYYWGGLNAEETAEQMDIAQNTVRVLLRQAKKSLSATIA